MSEGEFSKYVEMRRKGCSPAEVYRQAVADGVDEIACIRLLRTVFDLSLVEAKGVSITADGQTESLEEHQERLLPGIERALQDFEE